MESTHVIKHQAIGDSDFERVDPSLLTSPLRIPKARVSVREVEEETESAYLPDRLLRRASIASRSNPVEVVTRRAQPVLDEAEEQTQPEEPEPEPTIEEIEAAWQRRLEEAVAEAHEMGLKEGRRAAEEAYRKELDALSREFAENLEELRKAWSGFLARSEVDLAQLSFRIARAVLDAPLPAGVRRASEQAIIDAIEGMADAAALEVSVHPITYLRLQEAGLEEHLSQAHEKLRWKSDPNLKENEWIVQSNRAAVRRIEAELLAQIQRELALRQLSDEHLTEPPEMESPVGEMRTGELPVDESPEIEPPLPEDPSADPGPPRSEGDPIDPNSESSSI